MEARVSLIGLAVDDLGREVAFYRDGLGWAQSSLATEDVAFFQAGPLVVSLYARTSLARDLGRAVGEPSAAVTLAHNVRSPEEVDRVLAEAAAAGGELVRAAAATDWGGYVGYFADPEGHVWEVAWNPGFQLGEDGSLRLPG